MIQSLLKKVKIGSHIKVQSLKAFKIGHVGSQPIYHPDLLDLLETGEFLQKTDRSMSVSSADFKRESSHFNGHISSQEEVKSDDQENLLNFDMPIQIPKILESKAPTIVIDLSTFLCPSSS